MVVHKKRDRHLHDSPLTCMIFRFFYTGTAAERTVFTTLPATK